MCALPLAASPPYDEMASYLGTLMYRYHPTTRP